MRKLLLMLVVGVVALAGCGTPSPSYALQGPFPYCYGPEEIDDLEDVFDRDTIVWPEEACASGSLQRGFGIAYAPTWPEVPNVGEELDTDPDWGWHRTHRPGQSTRVIHVVHSSAPPPSSLLRTRPATIGSAKTRQISTEVAKQSRKTTPPAAVTSVKDDKLRTSTGSSTVTRGGLGADKRDLSTQQRLKTDTAASKAATLGRQKASTSAAVSKPSGGTSSVRSSRSGR